jgi:hypothetical protein
MVAKEKKNRFMRYKNVKVYRFILYKNRLCSPSNQTSVWQTVKNLDTKGSVNMIIPLVIINCYFPNIQLSSELPHCKTIFSETSCLFRNSALTTWQWRLLRIRCIQKSACSKSPTHHSNAQHKLHFTRRTEYTHYTYKTSFTNPSNIYLSFLM